MNRLLKQTLFILLVLFGLSFAQGGFIPLMVDYAVYRDTPEKAYLEIYLSFFQNNLQYVHSEDRLYAGYTITAQIFKGDSLIKERIRKMENSVPNVEDIRPDRQFVSLFAFELEEGKYEGKILVHDANSGNKGEFLFELSPKPFSGDSLQISDIELASSISRAAHESEFNKNTLQVIPNPSTVYGITLPVVYYYTEIYNLDYDANKPGEYLVQCHITDIDGNIVKQLPEKKKPKPGNSAVLVDGFNIITLPSNTYFLNIEVTDLGTHQSVKQKKRFVIYKPDKEQLAKKEAEQLNKSTEPDISEYAYLSEEEMDMEFKYAGYIASPQEKKIYKTLSVDGKRKFLSAFWKRKEEEHTGLDKTFKQDYFDRFNYANQHFTVGKRKGWQTGRGRVLLMYGLPDEIQRHYMDVDKKPYEIWLYNNLEGGVKFIFADLTGFGDFELIHSTYSKELYNPDWERLVHRAETSTGYDNDQPFR